MPNRQGPAFDLTGSVFGRLTVIGPGRRQRYGKRTRLLWVCLCSCGTRSEVLSRHLRTGATKSCGCLGREALVAASEKASTHGQARRRARSREYNTWLAMIDRCHNEKSKSFPSYGGRGIFVCKEWRDSFEAFFVYIGPRPPGLDSIDRIDNDRGYEPGNVRWATRKQQQRNMRSNALMTVDGETNCIAEWSERTGVLHATIDSRRRRGASAADALAPVVRAQKSEPCAECGRPVFGKRARDARSKGCKTYCDEHKRGHASAKNCEERHST